MSRRKSKMSRRRRRSPVKSALLAVAVVTGLGWGVYELAFGENDAGSSDAVQAQANAADGQATGEAEGVSASTSPRGAQHPAMLRINALVSELNASLEGKSGSQRQDVLIPGYLEFAKLLESDLPFEQREHALKAFNTITDEVIFSNQRNQFSQTYVIQKGDVLERIARTHQVTPELICDWNNIPYDRKHRIQPGQSLKIVPGPVRMVVDKSDFFMNYYIGELLARQYLIAHGRGNNTPLGDATVATKEVDPDMQPGAGPAQQEMDERWIGLTPFTEDNGVVRHGIGIHGTKYEDSIGQESSMGCIRMYNNDVRELYDRVPYNARVTIRA